MAGGKSECPGIQSSAAPPLVISHPKQQGFRPAARCVFNGTKRTAPLCSTSEVAFRGGATKRRSLPTWSAEDQRPHGSSLQHTTACQGKATGAPVAPPINHAAGRPPERTHAGASRGVRAMIKGAGANKDAPSETHLCAKLSKREARGALAGNCRMCTKWARACKPCQGHAGVPGAEACKEHSQRALHISIPKAVAWF